MGTIRSAMAWAAFTLDTPAVAVILGGTVIAAFRCRPIRTRVSPESPEVVSRFTHRLVGNLLLGLDLLVAPDVIHTAALEPTL